MYFLYPSNICGLNYCSKYVAKNYHFCQNNQEKKISARNRKRIA